MAKEVDLKKVELKVTVNCCDGCKRKVKKVLQGIEGVLKTEIDPLQPKVTVVGNVDPKILLKKLQRCGKQAEIWSSGNQNAGKQSKDMDAAAVAKGGGKEKSKTVCEQAKCSDSSAPASEKIKEISKGGGDSGENRDSKKEQRDSSNSCANTSCTSLKVAKNENSPLPPQVNFTMHPSMVHETGSSTSNSIRSCTQHCCMVEPCAITLPYYAIHSYTAPAPTLVPTCCSQGGYNLERLVTVSQLQPPPLQTPAALVGDYFSVENTVGCSVM